MRLPIPANSKQAGFRLTLPGRILGGNFRVADRTSRENPIARLRALSWFITFRFRRCDYLDSTGLIEPRSADGFLFGSGDLRSAADTF
jgi:hypothetical protein